MKSAVFACLLVIAGAYAFPQDIEPAQSRIVDLWLQNGIETLRREIRERGLDPVDIEKHEFDYVIFEDLVQVAGHATDLKFNGLSHIDIDNLYYNILLGRLDYDLVIRKLFLSVGQYKAEGLYGDRGGLLDVGGSVVVSDIRVRGDALLRILTNPIDVYLMNINMNFSVAAIEAKVEAAWKCLACAEPRDISAEANELLNETIPGLLQTFSNEINTLLGEAVRNTVNRWW